MKRLYLLLTVLLAQPAFAERIKDIANIDGIRPNQLVGYGVVVGLDNTGDTSALTAQGLSNLMGNLGLKPGQNVSSKNAASVMATAVMPAFAKPGQSLDVTVSALGATFAEARERAYGNVQRIEFQDAHYRTDIALRAGRA